MVENRPRSECARPRGDQITRRIGAPYFGGQSGLRRARALGGGLDRASIWRIACSWGMPLPP
jgi:hypothetical protein